MHTHNKKLRDLEKIENRWRDIVYVSFTNSFRVVGLPGQDFATIETAVIARDKANLSHREKGSHWSVIQNAGSGAKGW